MTIDEYYKIITFISGQLRELQVTTRYQELVSLLQQSQDSPSPEISTQLVEKRQEVYSALENTEPKNWDSPKMKLFYRVGGYLIGKSAQERVRSIFDEHQGNTAEIIQQIQALINETNALLETISRVREGLTPIAKEEEEQEEAKEGYQTIELIFDNEAAIKTLPDLENYAHTWQGILNAVSRLVNESPEEARIIQIQKNSPLVITIDAPVGVIAALYFIVDGLLRNYQNILNIVKTREEIKSLKLNNEKLLKAAEEAEKEEREELPKLIAKEVIEKYKQELKANTDSQTVKGLIGKVTEDVYDFIDKGGVVDVAADEQESGIHVEQMKLASKYKEVRQLQEANPDEKLLTKNVEKTIEEEQEEVES